MAPINLWYTVAAVAVLYFIVNGIQSFIRQRQFRRFARDHDAELPKIAPYLLPFGIDRLWRLIRAARGAEDIYDDIFAQAHKDHGRTFVSTGLGGQGIITCEPKNIQAILATQFDDFYLGPRRKAQFGVLLGNSIFSSDGPAWAHARAMFRPMFSRSNINDLEETENAVKVFLDVLPKGDDGWTSTADIQPLFYRFTM
jgi:cytochrome P450